MKKLLSSNETKYRLLRTIIQGVIGVVIANLDLIISGITFLPIEYKPIVVAVIMAILSPVMAMIGGKEDVEQSDVM